jgi:acetolactate synthase-1/3 small subunit
MTVVVCADESTARIIVANLEKLVDVLFVSDVTDKSNVIRDLALIKVSADPHRRAEILQICDVFRARIVDMGERSLIVEITGDQDKIDGLTAVLAPFGITEMVQCGAMAMTRGETDEIEREIHQRLLPDHAAA